MPTKTMIAGFILFVLMGAALGYVASTAYYQVARGGSLSGAIDWFAVAHDYIPLRRIGSVHASRINVIMGIFTILGLVISAYLVRERLTVFGTTNWQNKAELKKNGFFGRPEHGFLLGKTTQPKRRGQYISSSKFPHALVVAPTGRGKTRGFIIPNALTFAGSIVVLDVKGEVFEATSRYRKSMGDKVFRFALGDWVHGSHCYNPLQRIYELKNPHQQYEELEQVAGMFLQAEGNVESFLENGKSLFVAAALLAFERGKPTIGEVYRIVASGDKNVAYSIYSKEVKHRSAKATFLDMAGTNDKTLTSITSVMMAAGLRFWANPAIDAVTSKSEISFQNLRREGTAIYLVVGPTKVKAYKALIRLFFSDLLAALHSSEPGADEPLPVQILLDEFNRLGKMPNVADSIQTLRSYGGRLALVTQSIPALTELYGENTRLDLQANAGLKLYLTPGDEKTVTEMSESIGMTTRRVISKSKDISNGSWKSGNVSERSEEVPLLTKDKARDLDEGEIIIVVDAGHPIKAKALIYYEDPTFIARYKGQTGPLPYPDRAPFGSEAASKKTGDDDDGSGGQEPNGKKPGGGEDPAPSPATPPNKDNGSGGAQASTPEPPSSNKKVAQAAE